MKRLKGALVGTGNIGLGGHMPAYLDSRCIGSQAEIIAASDPSKDNLAKFSEMLPSARTYISTEELFEKESSLDFVDICTPPSTHTPIIYMAAKRKLHILCEKPLATSIDDVSAIRRIIKEKGVVFFPCHQYYYNPQWRVVQDAIDRKELGEPFYARFEVFRMSANMGNSNWCPDWRVDPSLGGGGIVVDHGTHLLYLATSLLGKPIAVTAKTRSFRKNAYKVEDTASIILEHERGISNIFLTWASSHRGFNFSILTPSCDVLVKDDSVAFMKNGSVKKVDIKENLSKSSKHTNLYPQLMENFFKRVRENDTKMDFFEEAAISAKCVFATYESCCKNKRIEII